MFEPYRDFVKRHRTKLLGSAAVAFTFAHQNVSELREVLEAHPKAYHLLGYTFGLLAVLLGFLNSQQQDRDGP